MEADGEWSFMQSWVNTNPGDVKKPLDEGTWDGEELDALKNAAKRKSGAPSGRPSSEGTMRNSVYKDNNN